MGFLASASHAQTDSAYYARINDSLRMVTDEEFRDPDHSPLNPKDRRHFEALEYFAFNPHFVLQARFEATPGEEPFRMRTTTSRMANYVKIGYLHFQIDSQNCRLAVYQNLDLIKRPGFENYLFLPFYDLTNSEETYGGGRYLDLQGPLGDSVIIDFNRAYNPYCAYSDRYSCPIPPMENRLRVRIEAGVLKYGEH